MGQLTQTALNKIAGATWDSLRDKFLELSGCLLDVAPAATGELTTIYIKFTVNAGPTSPVYAVVWVKNSKKWIVGMALPDDVTSPELGPAPPQKKYTGLTKYFTVTPEDPLPPHLRKWSQLAYAHVSSNPSEL